MRTWRLGLRGKSVLALGLACVVALVPTTLLGWAVLADMRQHFGLAYARNLTRLNREKILAPVSRDLALSIQMANSEIVRQWLLDENDATKRGLFVKEAESFHRALDDHAWFVAVAASRHFYYRNDADPTHASPSLTLNPDATKDSWFFATMASAEPFNIHADFDDAYGVTRVWFNVLVKDGERRLGIIGSAIDLVSFLKEFASDSPGVTPMVLDRYGAIEFHPNKALIARYWTTGEAAGHRTAFDLLDGPADRDVLAQALQQAERRPDDVATAWVRMGGKEQLIAVGYIPELQWHILSAVDLDAAHIIDAAWFRPAAAVVILLLTLLLAGFGFAVERLVLRPLRRLHHSATAIAAGQYQVALPAATGDEIGELAVAFGIMANRVERHTDELETKVQERTAALEDTNRAIVAAHKQIADSIDYASIIQRAILPDPQLKQVFGSDHFVLWRPRNVVGGDFYVCHPDDGANCLLGVVDCAGHGVPGALMTMAGRAAIVRAIHKDGARSPAAVLRRADSAIRITLATNQLAIATNMDAGLAYIDRDAGRLLFAGARIGIFWTDGATVEELKGSHRALGDRRRGGYGDQELPLVPGRIYHLVTDGFFDQDGGAHGFGFGKRRFAAMLREHAHLPLAAQREAFAATLARYQQGRPQRDDITMLSFRLG